MGLSRGPPRQSVSNICCISEVPSTADQLRQVGFADLDSNSDVLFPSSIEHSLALFPVNQSWRTHFDFRVPPCDFHLGDRTMLLAVKTFIKSTSNAFGPS